MWSNHARFGCASARATRSCPRALAIRWIIEITREGGRRAGGIAPSHRALPVRFAARSQSAPYVFEIAVVLRDPDPRLRRRGPVEASRARPLERWRFAIPLCEDGAPLKRTNGATQSHRGPPIPVCEDGAPLKHRQGAERGLVEEAIPVCEDGAPLKPQGHREPRQGPALDPRLRRRGPVEASAGRRRRAARSRPIPVCEDGAPLKRRPPPLDGECLATDPRLRRRGPVEAPPRSGCSRS